MKQTQRDPGDNQIEFPGTPEQEEPRREPGVEQIPDKDRDEDDVGIDPDLGDLDHGKAPAREQR